MNNHSFILLKDEGAIAKSIYLQDDNETGQLLLIVKYTGRQLQSFQKM